MPFPDRAIRTDRSGTVRAMSDRCDSCGDDGPDLQTVQRIYVVFDERNHPIDHRLADEFETWCAICRVTYPHQVVETDEG